MATDPLDFLDKAASDPLDFLDVLEKEKPSKRRSLVSAPIKGVIEAAEQFPSMFRGPISSELSKRLKEKAFPVLPEHEPLERLAKVGAFAAAGPESIPLKAAQTLAGTLFGEGAKKAGYGETAQSLFEAGGLGLPSLIKEGVQKASQLIKPKIGAQKFPYKGAEIPAGTESFELAEEALKKLEAPTFEKPQTGIFTPQFEKSIEAKPLTGRAKIISSQAESQISPEKFYNEKHGGINLSSNVKKLAKSEKSKVSNLYQRAEKVYKSETDIFPELSKKVDDLIDSLSLTAKPNPGEKAVLDQLEALKGVIGSPSGLIQTNLSRLIKTADSMSGLANYEMPYTGPKGMLKSIVKDINESVLNSLEKKGLNAESMRRADKAYSAWAHKFLADEISPFLEKTIRNPESLYRKSLADEGVYRALKDALGKKHPKSIEKLERGIVEVVVKPYAKNLKEINTPKFQSDMANLEGLIGKEKTNKVKNFLTKQQKISPRALELKGKKIPEHRITGATQEKVSEYLGKSPEEIEKMLDSRSGIRKLRENLKNINESELFDKLTEQKTLDILRGGAVGPEKLTGLKILENIRNKKNYEILSEIYGKDAVNAALVDASKAYKGKLITDKLKQLGKLAAVSMGAAKMYKVFTILV